MLVNKENEKWVLASNIFKTYNIYTTAINQKYKSYLFE